MEIPKPNENDSGFSDRSVIDEASDDQSAIVIDGIIKRIGDHPLGVDLDTSNREKVVRIYQELLKSEIATDQERPDIRMAKDLAISAFEGSYSKYLVPAVGLDAVTFSMFDMSRNPLTEHYPKNAAGGFSSGHGLIILNIPYSDQLVSRASEKSGISLDVLRRYLNSRMILHEYLHLVSAKTEYSDRGITEKSGLQIVTYPGDGTAQIINVGLNESATDYLAHRAILNQDPSLRSVFTREGEQPRYKLIAAIIKSVGEKTFIQSYLSNDVNMLRTAINRGKGNNSR
jgi:hypothetical protein